MYNSALYDTATEPVGVVIVGLNRTISERGYPGYKEVKIQEISRMPMSTYSTSCIESLWDARSSSRKVCIPFFFL